MHQLVEEPVLHEHRPFHVAEAGGVGRAGLPVCVWWLTYELCYVFWVVG